MTILKKWELLTLLLANALTFSACGNSNAKNNQVSIDNTIQQKTEASQQTEQKGTSVVQDELEKAKKAEKAVFVVVTGTGITETDKATAIAEGAKDIYKKSVIIQLNRDDSANAQLVSEYRLAGAPLPLILVLSPKGYPVGGYILSEATAENITALIPSPKLDEIYESLDNGKPAFVVVTKKSYTDKAKILENCKLAVSQLENKASIIEVDLDDTKEAGFIKQLNLKNSPNTSSVVVLNSAGQTTGSFEGSAEPTALVLAANKVIRSSCCPGSKTGCK